jgi:hypothetical protein
MSEQEDQLFALIELAQTQQTALTQAGADLRAAQQAFTAEISQKTTKAMSDAETALNTSAKALSARFFKIIAQVAGATVALLLVVLLMLWMYQLLAIDSLRTERQELQAGVDGLAKRGGRIKLNTCGDKKQLCAKVDKSAGDFKDGYMVLQGY